MRYSENEETVLVGILEPNMNVKIKIINLDSDALVSLKTDNCIESKHEGGVYMFSTKNIDKSTVPEHANLLYVMTTEEGDRQFGKFVYGGYMDEPITVTVEGDAEAHEEIKEKLDIINARL